MNQANNLIILTPIYEDVLAFAHLVKEIQTDIKGQIYLIAIDDGSISSRPSGLEFEQHNISGEIIRLRRNVGHQRAIALGLHYIAEKFPHAIVVVMDSDGEDRPKTIINLLANLEINSIGVVVAQRKTRIASASFKFFYQVYKAVFYILTGKKISFGNFMALTPFAVQRLVSMPELWVHVAGAVLISKLPIILEPIPRGSRYIGKSKMNFVSLALHGLRALIVFSDEILVRIGILCAALSFCSLVAMPVPIFLKSIGMASPGWASILFGVFLLIFIQAVTLGLITLLLSGLTKGNSMNYFDYKSLILEIKKITSIDKLN